jgi:TetR/AcrR family transcriptional regulator, mexCD-oprJ operon repressor
MTDALGRAETSTTILATAARLLAERPDATVGEIAAVSGVGRATVYRYFPTREALVEALEADALHELGTALGDAVRDEASLSQAIERLLRTFLAMGDRYVILARQVGSGGSEREAEIDRLISAPLRTLFQRGIDDGTFRRGFDAETLSRSFAGLALAAGDAGLPGRIGIDATADLVASLFLDGARRSKSKGKSKSKRPVAG